jgi:nucleoside 2-deoxyribosyltransferase
MKVYFTASIHWRDKYGEYYRRIVDFLTEAGCEVIADHILYHKRKDILEETDEEKIEFYQKFISWVRSADIVVAEISTPSTVNVGHEISVALGMGKPVIAFYLEGADPVLMKAIPSEKIRVVEYTAQNLEELLAFELEEVEKLSDHRFTLLLPADIMAHLDQVAETGMTRSEYIRELVKKDMRRKKE